MNGKWVSEGLVAAQAALSDNTTINLTHFIVSGAQLLADVIEFDDQVTLTEATFPAEQYRAEVHNTYVDPSDGHLMCELWISASSTISFFANGVGIVHDDGINPKLMAIAKIPLQERQEGVFTKIFVKLPVIGDLADVIDVSFRADDHVTPAELEAHNISLESHEILERRFEHTQVTPSNKWIVNHNLNRMNIPVTRAYETIDVIGSSAYCGDGDTMGDEGYCGDGIEYVMSVYREIVVMSTRWRDANNCDVFFVTPVSGKVALSI